MLPTCRPRPSIRHPRPERPIPASDQRWERRPRSTGTSSDRRRCGGLVIWGLLGVAALLSLLAPRLARAQAAAVAAPTRVQVAYSRLPLAFEANARPNRWPGEVSGPRPGVHAVVDPHGRRA